MCKAHRKLDSYFVDYQMRITKLDEKCASCTKKDEIAEWARKEQEMLLKRKEQQKRDKEQLAEQEKREVELLRLRGLSHEDLRKR
jgi:hypothetical protein